MLADRLAESESPPELIYSDTALSVYSLGAGRKFGSSSGVQIGGIGNLLRCASLGIGRANHLFHLITAIFTGLPELQESGDRNDDVQKRGDHINDCRESNNPSQENINTLMESGFFPIQCAPSL